MMLAKQLAMLHFEVHKHSADPSVIPTQEDAYLQKIQTRKTLSEKEREQLSDIIRNIPECKDRRACHGDFHPFSIKKRFVVILHKT